MDKIVWSTNLDMDLYTKHHQDSKMSKIWFILNWSGNRTTLYRNSFLKFGRSVLWLRWNFYSSFKKKKQKKNKPNNPKRNRKKTYFGITCINKVYTCSWDISLDYICDWCSTNRTLLQGNATAATAANVATRFKQHPSILIETYFAQSLFLEVFILSQYFV